MIGIIGPADSTELALSVARDEGLADSVIARAYESIGQAGDLAQELDQICQVLLFTGRVPYVLARRTNSFRASLQYVPHSSADLYRTLVRLLREFKGEMPRVSLDTIEPHIVREAYQDLGLDPPSHVLSLEVEGEAEAVQSTADIVAFHVEAQRSGSVEGCLTCLGAVYVELASAGVPAWRVTHTRSVMREALRQAQLAARLAITEATQPAAVLIKVPDLRSEAAEDSRAYEKQRQRLRVRQEVLDLAERLKGRMAELDDQTFVVYTSRGTIEEAVSRLSARRGGPLELRQFLADVRLGVGLGATVPIAEENARRALIMAEGDRELHVAFADGEVFRVGGDGQTATYKLRETRESTLRLARQLGLGPLALTRLTRALRQVNTSAVTASELAQAYGIQPRSTRRIITALQRAGIATAQGRHGGTAAGRPQTVYRIDLERLLPSEDPK
jgi:hypothetical protein